MKKTGDSKIAELKILEYTRKLYFLRVNEKKYCHGKT